MAREIILNGTYANDGTGDNLRETANKINRMFAELYGPLQFLDNGDFKIINTTGKVIIGTSETTPAITIPQNSAELIQIGTNTNPLIIGSNANENCKSITVPQCSVATPIEIDVGNGGLIIGDPTSPSITVPAINSQNPIKIGDSNSPVEIGTSGNPGITVPPATSSNPINVGGTNAGGVGLGNPSNPGIFVPTDTNQPIQIGGDGTQPVSFNLNKTPHRVVFTNASGQLDVDEYLQYNSNSQLVINNKDAFFEVAEMVEGGVPSDNNIGWRWKGTGAHSTSNYVYIRGGYSNANMASERGVLEIGIGSPLSGEDGFAQPPAITVSHFNHVGISHNEGAYNANHVMTIGGSTLFPTNTGTNEDQVFQAWGTSAGQQIYQGGTNKVGQLGNQGNTYWLGTGGANGDPFASGSRCITWNTDCKVVIGNDTTGITVPSVISGEPITIGGADSNVDIPGNLLMNNNAGTAGQVLTSNGSGNPATWSDLPSTTPNLAGGDTGSIPYQSAADTTAMLSAGTEGQVLKMGADGIPTWSTDAGGISGITVTDDDTGNVDYNIVLTTATTGSIAGVTVDGGDIKYNPSTGTLTTTEINTTHDGFFNGMRVGHGAANVETNSVVGKDSLMIATEGANNTAMGYQSLKSVTTGSNLTAFGYQAGMNATTAAEFNVFGFQAGYSNTTGHGLTAVGYQAGYANTTGWYNSYIGSHSGSNIVGEYNTVVGGRALFVATSGNNNTIVGADAALYKTSGNNNTSLGYYCLHQNGDGSNNVALGFFAGRYETGSNSFYLDSLDRGNLENSRAGALMYGTFDATPANQTLTINAKVTTQTVKTTPVTVANLPSASAVGAGTRAFVTDATASTFYSVVTGGGSTGVPVFSDGTNWRIG